MEPKIKKWIAITLAILVVIIAGVETLKKKPSSSNLSQNSAAAEPSKQQTQTKLVSTDLLFTSGRVTSVVNNTIQFQSGPNNISASAEVSAQTQLLQQGASGTDSPAGFSNLTPNTSIVLYYSSPPIGTDYKPYKIRILTKK